MKTHEIIDKNDPQCLQKFKALAKAKVQFAVTNINPKNDLDIWSHLAAEYGLQIVKTDLNSFYFAPK